MEIRTVLSQLDEDPTLALSVHRMDDSKHDTAAHVRTLERMGERELLDTHTHTHTLAHTHTYIYRERETENGNEGSHTDVVR